ncbi:MAG TPA: hypothetical protein VGB04_02945 [Allosphingosinicella sp.]|jgi:hypothetical protein
MVDVRLLYPLEKAEAAARLADSIAAAGYQVEREGLGDGRAFPDLAAEAGKAKALLLIWSRGLVSAAMAGTALASARRHPNLIEVSADGIEPAGTEASPVILLSGWRGQPYHQGWQRILGEIKRLCGAGEAPARSLGPLAAEKPATGREGAATPRRLTIRTAVAAGALIAASLGAVALHERGSGDSATGGERAAAVAAAGRAPPAPRTQIAAAPAPLAPIAPEAQAGPAAAPPPAAPAPATSTAPAPEAISKRAVPRRPATAQRRSARERLAVASAPEVKRYSRKHSKTMRLFCQRSGRSTPQCRTFARSIRDRDG